MLSGLYFLRLIKLNIMSKAKLKGAEINCIAKIGGKMKANDCYRCFTLFMVSK